MIVATYPIHVITQEGHKAMCTYTGAVTGAFKIMGNGVSPATSGFSFVPCFVAF